MSGSPKRELNADNRRFSILSPTQFSQAGPGEGSAPGLRKFSGVAYSGEMIPNHWYWGNVVFDLSTMSIPDKLPALMDHDRSKRCGYVTDTNIDTQTGFAVGGNLLSNEYGKSVAQDSDEGFPWQMSVDIDPGRIEDAMPGKQVMVNGKQFTGPITIFRDSVISEVSFTATGYDGNTTATAMSRGNTPPTGADMNQQELETQNAALAAEVATLKASKATLQADLTTTQGKLEQFSKAKRLDDVERLFTDTGMEYKADADNVKAFCAMPDEAFGVTAETLRTQFAHKGTKPSDKAQENLFSHQAQGGAGDAPNSSKEASSGLVAQAQKRNEQFAKTHGRH